MREYFNPDWTEYCFGLLFTATWSAAVLTVISLVAALCLRGVAVRKVIWTACVVGLALAPVLSLVLPHCFLAYRSQLEPLHYPTQMIHSVLRSAAVQSVWFISDSAWGRAVGRTLLVVWLAGAGVALGRLLWGWSEMVRLLRRARPCRDPRVSAILQRIGELPRDVVVLELEGLVGAICWQIRRAKIILSADLERLSDAELEMVLRHECAHLARSDPSMLFVQRLVEIVYWFHPLVWWASLEVSKSREYACDDAVLEARFEPAEYAQCLGRLALWYYAPVPLAPAGLGMLWNQHVVLLRVKRLLQRSATPRALSLLPRSIVYLAACSILLGISIVRLDWDAIGRDGHVQWTAWPGWTAAALDTVGIRVRDFPLDAHRHDPNEKNEATASLRQHRNR